MSLGAKFNLIGRLVADPKKPLPMVVVIKQLLLRLLWTRATVITKQVNG